MRGVVVRRALVALLALVAAIGLSLVGGVPAEAHGNGGSHGKVRPLTCKGGEIGSGTYSSITVTGVCSVAENAVIRVKGDITVRRGASLDAQSSASTIMVGRNVSAYRGSTLGLGCQPAAVTGNSAHPCVDADGNPIEDPNVFSTITVKGNVTARGAAVVLINGITIGRNLTIAGGGSPDIPWSVKNNTVKGNLSTTNVVTNWYGVLFNTVGRNVTLLNITLTEDHPGAAGVVYVVRNTIGRNLVCWQLPGVSGGFVPGSVNTVGGRALGQCKDLAG